MTTSKASPPAMRLASAPAVSLSTMILSPDRFSKSGTSAVTTDLKAPAVSTLISAAEASAPPIRTPSARQDATRVRIVVIPLRSTPFRSRLAHRDCALVAPQENDAGKQAASADRAERQAKI